MQQCKLSGRVRYVPHVARDQPNYSLLYHDWLPEDLMIKSQDILTSPQHIILLVRFDSFKLFLRCLTTLTSHLD